MKEQEFLVRVENIRNQLYRMAYLYFSNESLAMDVLDEAIYKALKGYKKLRDDTFFETWITRILINECHKEWKYRKRNIPLEETEEISETEYDALPLKLAIAKLSKELRDVVVLRYFNGFTTKETAEVLKIPQGTAATRLRKALQLLKLELGEEDDS